VSTHAYVNPVVAVLLGVLFANEKMSAAQLLGLTIILVQRPADQPGKIQEGACLRQGCVRKGQPGESHFPGILCLDRAKRRRG